MKNLNKYIDITTFFVLVSLLLFVAAKNATNDYLFLLEYL